MKKNIWFTITFILMIALTLLVMIAPFILKEPLFYSYITDYLSAIPTADYKGVYISFIGGIWGSWLAITGALWTQRRFENQNRVIQSKESALIVYYDFDFAFKDLQQFASSYYHNSISHKKNENNNNTINIFFKNRLNILIDNEWIHNVAKLNNYFTKEEIKLIYNTYGHLCYIKNLINGDGSIELNNEKEIYTNMILNFYNLNTNNSCKVTLRSQYSKLMDHLNKFINS